ncbi:nucleotidyl transferase AbiEii/AbiGii toxin family protein [Fibrobacter sp. UWEL]|uniref:nucleotidyl transferase AbiEii/AbiGii toxin family protein n=1 Tax=Fibrobacter sp. UWEL TaxID=1896209 RepID=UPI000920B9B1|nr:nucleotidyl transferase AbiEii/AbiGii toxin family protein [Fibrobacter sp. UWEL]SHL04973.1 Nucleotidyl transferase AbiEii toxin, Type IV TA system [Fibrobacter sp. UWEL]
MNAIESMLAKYNCKNVVDYRNALKEIIQEVALCGLSRGGFFEKAAFYGGTALRIFYGLDRFSEDMDFSLKAPDAEFDLTKYFSALKDELEATGFEITIEAKSKNHWTLKATPLVRVPNNETLKIKFEVDTNPPAGASYQNKYALLPSPFAVRLHDEPSLFAGKLHAVLCRAWQNRVKGRDFYDYVWYLSKGIRVNLNHLQNRLEQSGHWQATQQGELTIDKLKQMLCERFETIDFVDAKNDVSKFINDQRKLDLWSPEFFVSITNDRLEA